jgi:hypothetical protein
MERYQGEFCQTYNNGHETLEHKASKIDLFMVPVIEQELEIQSLKVKSKKSPGGRWNKQRLSEIR